MVRGMSSAVASGPSILHLSLITGGVLRDGAGGQLGRVDDLVVRLGDADYPPVTGLLATVAGRQVFVPARVAEIEHGTWRSARARLRPFERRPQEVLLKQDVLDRQLINVDGARLVRTNEIELARVDGWYRVVGVDIGLRGLARRLLPRRLATAFERRSSSTGQAWSRSPGTSRRCGCESRTRSSRGSIRRSSPTSSRPPRTARARRSSGRRRATGARGRRVRGARRPSTSSSSSRSAPTPRSRDARRAWSPTTPPTCSASSTRSGASRSGAAAAAAAPPGAHAARLRPGDGRRADEPRLRLRLRARDPAGSARARPACPVAGRHAHLDLHDERAPAPAAARSGWPTWSAPTTDARRRDRCPPRSACTPTPSSRRSRG